MKIIGLTGGIACGKTTVSKFLQEKKIPVIDADKIAWQLAEPGHGLWQKYVDRYGQKVLQENQSLNRQAVANIVFAQPEEKAWLDSVAGHLILQEIQQQLANYAVGQAALVCIDIPLLYEFGWEYLMDVIWVVSVSQEMQLARLEARNGYSRAEAQRRIAAQMPLALKCQKADVVIDNNEGVEQLYPQIEKALQQIMSQEKCDSPAQ